MDFVALRMHFIGLQNSLCNNHWLRVNYCFQERNVLSTSTYKPILKTREFFKKCSSDDSHSTHHSNMQLTHSSQSADNKGFKASTKPVKIVNCIPVAFLMRINMTARKHAFLDVIKMYFSRERFSLMFRQPW